MNAFETLLGAGVHEFSSQGSMATPQGLLKDIVDRKWEPCRKTGAILRMNPSANGNTGIHGVLQLNLPMLASTFDARMKVFIPPSMRPHIMEMAKQAAVNYPYSLDVNGRPNFDFGVHGTFRVNEEHKSLELQPSNFSVFPALQFVVKQGGTPTFRNSGGAISAQYNTNQSLLGYWLGCPRAEVIIALEDGAYKLGQTEMPTLQSLFSALGKTAKHMKVGMNPNAVTLEGRLRHLASIINSYRDNSIGEETILDALAFYYKTEAEADEPEQSGW